MSKQYSLSANIQGSEILCLKDHNEDSTWEEIFKINLWLLHGDTHDTPTDTSVHADTRTDQHKEKKENKIFLFVTCLLLS